MNNKTRKQRASHIPGCIRRMIKSGYDRGETSKECARRINASNIARKFKVKVNAAQIAAAFAWITMRS